MGRIGGIRGLCRPPAEGHSPVAASPPAASPAVASTLASLPASIPDVQTPAMQVVPDGQANAAPQPLQLLLSFMVLTHAPAQSVGEETLSHTLPQTGTTPLQVAAPWIGATHGAQVVPHELREVEVSLTHVPEQACVPAGHTQAEPWQTFPPVQACDAPAVLHAPQLFVSVRVLVSQPFESIPSQLP